MGIDSGMTSHALTRAKKHVYNVCQQGLTLTLFKAATKDAMGSALTEVTQDLKAFPIRFSPYDRETTEKISWAENTDVLCFVPKLTLDKLSITTQQLQFKYKSFRFNKKTYEMRYIENYSPFGTDFLYVVIGGKI